MIIMVTIVIMTVIKALLIINIEIGITILWPSLCLKEELTPQALGEGNKHPFLLLLLSVFGTVFEPRPILIYLT